MIISYCYRKKMRHLWQKAVAFLKENETRVREEVQQVHGEEFAVWRWLQVILPFSSHYYKWSEGFYCYRAIANIQSIIERQFSFMATIQLIFYMGIRPFSIYSTICNLQLPFSYCMGIKGWYLVLL